MDATTAGLLMDLVGVIMLSGLAMEPKISEDGDLELADGWLYRRLGGEAMGREREASRRIATRIRWTARVAWALVILGFGLQAAGGW